MWSLCVKCNRHKSLWEFNKCNEGAFGIQRYCKKCQSDHNEIYRRENSLKRKAYKKQYNAQHKDRVGVYNRQYHILHRDSIIDRQHRYREVNKDASARRSAKRRTTKLKQTTDLTVEEKYRINLLYKWADMLGEAFQVDHIIPISKGGLHHPDNLHIIPRIQNLKKKDRNPKDFYSRFYDFIVGKG